MNGAGKKVWGRDPVSKAWVPIKVSAGGEVHTLTTIDKLDDIEDIDLTGIADGYFLYWDATASLWKAKAFPEHGADMHTDVTRHLFIPALTGASMWGGTQGWYSNWPAWWGAANAMLVIVTMMKVPSDFVSFTKCEAIWTTPAAAGNMYWNIEAYYASAGEDYHQHGDHPALGTTANAGAHILNVQEPANPLTLASLVKDDYINLNLSRLGNNALDTIDDIVYFHGFLFTYTAEQ